MKNYRIISALNFAYSWGYLQSNISLPVSDSIAKWKIMAIKRSYGLVYYLIATLRGKKKILMLYTRNTENIITSLHFQSVFFFLEEISNYISFTENLKRCKLV